MNKRTTAHLALLFTNLFFAINLSAVKQLTHLQLAKPFGINVVRVGVSVILFWLIYLIKPTRIKIDRQDIKRFVLCALTGIAINQLLFLKGLSLTYSIHAALLMLTTPLLIVCIATWILKERISITKMTGLALGISGAFILIAANDSQGTGGDVFWGDILILLNAVSYTFYFILVKPLMAKYDAVMVIRWIFTFGLLMVLPFGWSEFIQIQWQHFSTLDFVCMTLIVFTGTFLAYLFNVYGIKVLGSTVAGFYIYTQPVFAALIAILFLKEHLLMYKIIAALLIFSGVYLVNKQPQND